MQSILGAFEVGVKVNVRTPFSDLTSKLKFSVKTGLIILLHSLGKANSMSSSCVNHSFEFFPLRGFLRVLLTIRTAVIAHLYFELFER
jgi:hypothetical protein